MSEMTTKKTKIVKIEKIIGVLWKVFGVLCFVGSC